MKDSILYISSIPWDFSWHRQQEMMSKMADAGYRVLFVQPCVKKKPFAHALVKMRENIWLLQPSGLPYERCLRSIHIINAQISKRQIAAALKSLNMQRCILWLDRLHGFDYGYFRQGRCAIYDLVDEITAFGRFKNKGLLISLENAVLRDADLLLSSSNTLLKRKISQSGRRGESLFLPNGVDCRRFACDMHTKQGEQEAAAGFSESALRIGFVGDISERRLNYKLIQAVARMRPDWRFVFVGPGRAEDKKKLSGNNIIVQDAVPGEEIPGIIAGFDVGVIPYNTEKNDMDYVFPRKACEYLASGIPVVGTPLAELREMSPWVRTAGTALEFAAAIEAAASEQVSPQERKAFAGRFDWDVLLEQL